MQQAAQRQGRATIARLAHNLESARSAYEAPQSRSNEFVVVDQNDPGLAPLWRGADQPRQASHAL
jgi:hypothetical protein